MRKTLIMIVMLMVAAMAVTAWAEDVERMSVTELRAQIDAEDLVVIDVRRGSDWDASEFKIQGAIRVDPKDVEAGIADLDKTKRYVLYCA